MVKYIKEVIWQFQKEKDLARANSLKEKKVLEEELVGNQFTSGIELICLLILIGSSTS
jgi:hypothetical protein